MSLIKTIQNGEGKTVEFKEELTGSQAIAKSVVAFSNTAGGKLIFGVNDQGEVIGLKQDVNIFELQDKIASIIYETCYPNILPDIYTSTINDHIVLVIEVYRGNLLPYYLKKFGKDEGVYIRVGATNRKASRENILELERQRMNISFDQDVNREVITVTCSPNSRMLRISSRITSVWAVKSEGYREKTIMKYQLRPFVKASLMRLYTGITPMMAETSK